MQMREAKKSAFSKLIFSILVLSMLILILPLNINAVSSGDNYSLPWLWPVPGSYVVTGLDHYADGTQHDLGNSMDIGNNGYTGSTRLDVVSATGGEVLYIQKSYDETNNRGSGWGNYVIVKSGNYCIVYAHLQSVTCKYGKINAGDVIGKMGNTGNSSEVHLHVQAYPSNKSATNTDIYVFDKYINNPLYVSNFKFKDGVTANSVRYGTHLTAYYKTLSSGMHVYSGGHFGNYGEISLGATVKSVRTNGARIYSQPLSSSTVKDTVAFGGEIRVYGYYTDGYGNVWYIADNNSLDKWIPESDVGFYAYSFAADYKDEYPPSGTYGSFSDIYFGGRISVSNTIKMVRAEIRDDSGLVASYETLVDSNEFDINNKFSSGFGIDDLKNGKYKYEIFINETASFPGADTQGKYYSVFSSDIIIDKSASDDVPPLVEDIKITSMTDSAINLSVIATDNKKVQQIYFTVTNGNGFNATLNSTLNGSVYSVEIPFSSLNGAGSYTLTVKAFDPYMNSDESSIVFTVPSSNGSEIYKVQLSSSSNLNLRAGPGTNYKVAGKAPNGSLVTITDVVYNSSDGRYWGYTANGWCALNYAVYQSGAIYKITFNTNGGTADYSIIDKQSCRDIMIPAAPIRPGFTFVGWGSSPTSTVAEYKAGDVYSKNESAVLFAIWLDNTAPTISDVTVSVTGSAGDSVSVTVRAADDSGTVYYSFDGGVSYRRSNSAIIFGIEKIPANTILVKDAAGNVTPYTVEIIVPDAGTLPPALEGFAPGSSLSAQVNGDCFVVNAHSLTADKLISLMAKPDNIKIYDKSGALMNGGSALVYSGCTISTLDTSNVTRTLTIVILGDADRNGALNYNDVVKIMKLSNGMAVSSDQLDKLICDLDGDGRITSLDAAKLYTMTK
ncbi:MAG: peptidoglycan DD-metalloendopeptidase family protein [Clostridia bacterium]|nr:peptidoglycan DD-metalloendopeptidase family protein [Clostridia bacterium]